MGLGLGLGSRLGPGLGSGLGLGFNHLNEPNDGQRGRAVLLEHLLAQPEGEAFGLPRSDPPQGVRCPPTQSSSTFEHDRVPSRTQLARNTHQGERPGVGPAASDGVRVVDEHEKHGLGTSALGTTIFRVERPQVPARSVSAWRGWRVLALDATYRVGCVLRSCARDEAVDILAQLAQRALAEPAARARQAQRTVLSHAHRREEEVGEEEQGRRIDRGAPAAVSQL